jgi:hypothetical protein
LISDVLEALDGYVARNGYGKALTTSLAIVSALSFVSALFGSTWLRAVVAFLMLLAVLLLVLLGITERRRLHDRIELDADTINRYVGFIGQRSPFMIRSWTQVVTIARNGDAVIRREMSLSRADDSEPHFLEAKLSYYGKVKLTDAMKRRVNVDTYRSNPADGDRGTRAHRTYSWSATPAGKPRMDVVVHLDGGIEEGEVIVVEWSWPRYSEDLRTFRSTELFDVVFRRTVSEYRYEIRLKDCGGVEPVIGRRGVTFTARWQGDDYVVTFGQSNPAVGGAVGVEVDMNPTRQTK